MKNCQRLLKLIDSFWLTNENIRLSNCLRLQKLKRSKGNQKYHTNKMKKTITNRRLKK